ncbi:MAG: hypothetical protein ACXWC4_04050 [Telluria sp.]
MTRKTAFDPFANEADELEVGRLAIENRLDRVTLAGDLDITADRQGLAAARLLHELLGEVVRKLEAMPALPERLPPPSVQQIDNPFS